MEATQSSSKVLPLTRENIERHNKGNLSNDVPLLSERNSPSKRSSSSHWKQREVTNEGMACSPMACKLMAGVVSGIILIAVPTFTILGGLKEGYDPIISGAIGLGADAVIMCFGGVSIYVMCGKKK